MKRIAGYLQKSAALQKIPKIILVARILDLIKGPNIDKIKVRG